MAQMNEHTLERNRTLRCDVLLVTATNIETQAILNVFSLQNIAVKRRQIGESTYFDLGVIGGSRTFQVQSEMGAGGPGGAGLVVYEGIKALSPSAVIMVGIAFGLIPDEQHMGDILVSRQLAGYELQKIEQESDGREIIRPRGDRVQASSRLLSLLRASIFDWEGPKVHFGLILSGDKLVKNKNFRKKLLDIEPEAIGGEMEGTGVYAAAQRNRIDWIVVKAIADWADGDKDDTYQKQAAKNAALFLLHVLDQEEPIENSSSAPPPAQTAREAPSRGRARGTLLCMYDIHSSYVVAVAWEPGGNRIASAGGDGLVRVWEADTGHTLLTYRGHPWVLKKVNMAPTVYVVAWSPEGLRLASAGVGASVHVWDAATGQDIVIYSEHVGLLPDVWALDWSPDGKRIASACSAISIDKTIHIWNATRGAKILHYDSKYGMLPNFSVSAVTWSPDGARIASTCGDKTIRLWDATTGKPISAFKISSDWVYKVVWSPDGRYLALANGDSTAQILDGSTGRILRTYSGHQKGVRDIAWSPDGSHLATASNDTTVQIWDAKTATSLYSYEEHGAWTTAVAWSPDGTCIASASNDKTVRVWQAI